MHFNFWVKNIGQSMHACNAMSYEWKMKCGVLGGGGRGGGRETKDGRLGSLDGCDASIRNTPSLPGTIYQVAVHYTMQPVASASIRTHISKLNNGAIAENRHLLLSRPIITT